MFVIKWNKHMLAKLNIKNKKKRGVVFSALIILADRQSVSYLHKVKEAVTLHNNLLTQRCTTTLTWPNSLSMEEVCSGEITRRNASGGGQVL